MAENNENTVGGVKRKIGELDAENPSPAKKQKINPIEVSNCSEVVEAVKNNRSFSLTWSARRLSLAKVLPELGANERDFLLQNIEECNQTLTLLDLHDTKLSEEEFTTICSRALVRSVSEIDFRNCLPERYWPDCLTVRNLTFIDLSRTTFLSDRQVMGLVTLIESNRCLEILKLNDIDEENNLSLFEIFQAVKQAVLLREFEFGGCPCTTEEYDCLINSLSQCSHLTNLNLSKFTFTLSDREEDLLRPLGRLTSLKRLSLSRCNISTAKVGALQFVDSCLDELDLSYNKLTSSGIESVMQTVRARSINVMANTGLDLKHDYEKVVEAIKGSSTITAVRFSDSDWETFPSAELQDHLELNTRRWLFQNGAKNLTLSTDLKIQSLYQAREEKQAIHQAIASEIQKFAVQIKAEEAILQEINKNLATPVEQWTASQVVQFLKENNASSAIEYFNNDPTDGESLLQMTYTHFKNAGVKQVDINKIQRALFVKQHNLKKEPLYFSWNKLQVLENLSADIRDSLSAPEIHITGKEFLFLDYNQMMTDLKLRPRFAALLQKEIQKIKKSIIQGQQKPPDHLICPITYELMKDPVIASDGQAYERTAIEDWLKKNDRSPMTNEVLLDKKLYPCQFLKNAIAEYLAKNSQ